MPFKTKSPAKTKPPGDRSNVVSLLLATAEYAVAHTIGIEREEAVAMRQYLAARLLKVAKKA